MPYISVMVKEQLKEKVMDVINGVNILFGISFVGKGDSAYPHLKNSSNRNVYSMTRVAISVD